MSENARPMMNTREVAEALGVAVRTVETWCRQERMPGARRYGRRWFIPRAVVEGIAGGRWNQARWSA